MSAQRLPKSAVLACCVLLSQSQWADVGCLSPLAALALPAQLVEVSSTVLARANAAAFDVGCLAAALVETPWPGWKAV